MLLYEFLRERMVQFPNQTISDENTTLTYSEALSYAENFAEELQRGLRSNSPLSTLLSQLPVGVLCRSELNTGLGLLACFKAGITAVPLSSRYGDTHVERIVRRIGLSHIITDEDGKLSIKQIASNPSVLSSPANLRFASSCFPSPAPCVIMCTSGTTGAPKGAMLTDENLITNLNDIGHYFSINETDKILISRPIYHSGVLTGEFLISLCRGLNIRFYNGEFNPLRLIKEIQEQKATVFGGTPTIFYHLCQTALRGKTALPIRAAAVSGECMTEAAAKAMRSAMPNIDIYSVYGLTEASPRVSALPPDQFDRYQLSVGFPLKSVEAKVENGELLIRGKSIMKGYYNDPEKTKRAFVSSSPCELSKFATPCPPFPDSCALNPNSCFLRTGDAASIDNEGRITIKGRLDNMIIRAGMNIFPQEIENALKTDPRITDALAYGEQSGVTQRLCVKVVADGLNKQDIMSICREHLPLYEIPDMVEIVDSLPRNASGKLLRPKRNEL